MIQKRIYLLAMAMIVLINTRAQNPASFKVTKTGNGKQNIILICGFACSSKVWDETVKDLSKKATCFTLNFSGFAGNEPQTEPLVPLWERDIVNFITANKLQASVLIGHSLGGTMVLELAAQEPKLFSKIVVLDAFPCLPKIYDTAFTAKDPINYEFYTEQFTKMNNSAFYNMQRAGITQILSDTTKVSMILDWAMKSDRKTLGKVYGYFMNIDLRQELSKITCPSLILLQPKFKNVKDVVQAQYASLKNAEIKYATRGLHFIMYDDREWYLNALKTFLRL